MVQEIEQQESKWSTWFSEDVYESLEQDLNEVPEVARVLMELTKLDGSWEWSRYLIGELGQPYRMIASDVWSTDEAVEKINAAKGDLVNISGASDIGLAGFDPVSFFEGGAPKNGSPMIRASYGGATYLFADEQTKSEFESNPARYAPKYGEFCAYGVSLGILLPVDITTAQVRNGKLYLNVNSEILKKFNADLNGSVEKANKNWPELFGQFAQ